VLELAPSAGIPGVVGAWRLDAVRSRREHVGKSRAGEATLPLYVAQ
jgi:hypothetical protein